MKDFSSLYNRYIRDPIPVRLAGIAANLARIKSFSNHLGHRDVVDSLLEESKFFIEWTAPDVEIDMQVVLMELQLQLAMWHRHWQDIWCDSRKLANVSKLAEVWSNRILEKSGILG